MNNLLYQPDLAAAHLSPAVWRSVNIQLLQKMLSEFSHEMLIVPQLIAQQGNWDVYEVKHTEKPVYYRFSARVLSLDHWDIDAFSISKVDNGQTAELDAVAFIVEFADQLGLGAGKYRDLSRGDHQCPVHLCLYA